MHTKKYSTVTQKAFAPNGNLSAETRYAFKYNHKT